MPTIKLNDRIITYSLRLDKRRKTIQLRLLPTAVVEIAAPGKLTADEVKQILTSKSRWLTGRLNKQAALAANPVNQTLTPGSQLLYQGQTHTLVVLPGSDNKPEVIIKPSEILVKLPVPKMDAEHSVTTEQILKAWLINQAGEQFLVRTKHWAALIGVRPVRITIRDQKTRWGSCSSLGNINYNWRVIMAPPRVADYLIIHELCHLLEPNHSVKFWNEVRKFAPDYQECRKWLTDNGKVLCRIF
ncbi:putative metal-dependent hydrolase [uncultured Sporomusa sp.]|uniref:Putative metal-dependent hydrolase n=1 Tax=uncultured Sporomusa sp. TaxID=307249 RepID=A0A212LR29_9FIRM|nr:SprT family zinc-dependent metalloprotease [uncultured Sporomusa sp.]SCM79900.1 putative metal-dependent hydrolase [uncultured Sporomusa sp.]